MLKTTLTTTLRWTLRTALWAGVAVLACLVVAALVFQLWFLPRANDYRDDIALAIGRVTGVHIQIGALSGHWRHWRPAVVLRGVVLKDPQGQDALAIDEIKSEMAWKSLLLGEIRVHSLEVSRLMLEVRRQADGSLSIAGIPLSMGEDQQSGLGKWLLRQDSIQVTDSVLRWIDANAGAAPLELTGVQLTLKQRFGVNSIEVRATPPITLGAPFALRVQIRGDHAAPLWRRPLEMELDFPYLNGVEAVRHWPTLPAVEQGAGGITAHAEMDDGVLTRARANVALANVSVRLGQDLEPLQLERLTGELELVREPGSIELQFRELSFNAGPDVGQSNVNGEFSRRVDEAGNIDMTMRFDALDLAPVALISNRLPLATNLRARLERMAPKGTLKKFQLSMREQAGQVTKFNISSDFERVSLNALEIFPGVGSMSGSVKGSDSSGTVVLTGRQAWLDLPKLLPARVPLEQLDARVLWTRRNGQTQITLQDTTLSNADFAAKLTGGYRHVPGTPGSADLSATLTRAQASAVWRYVPLKVPESIRQWLQRALVAGTSNQASIVLRGELSRFPFVTADSGLFEIKSKFAGGVLDYAPGWPRIEDITGDLNLRGSRIDISNGAGRINRANVSGVSVAVPDYSAHDPRVSVRGVGVGDSAEFMRFVRDSPLSRLTGSLTGDLRVLGSARLNVSLELPLIRPDAVAVEALYSMQDNQLMLPAGLGTLEQLNANVRITQKGAAVRDASANYLGGAVRADVTAHDNGEVEIRAAGRAGAAGIGRLVYPAWERFLTGSCDWKGEFNVTKERTRFVIDSTLVGLGSKLPEPLNKAEGEALHLRVERSPHDSGLSLLRAQLGGRILLRYLAPEADMGDIKTGELVFAGVSGSSDREGIRVGGRLQNLDADAWRALMINAPAPASNTSSHRGIPPVTIQGLKIDRLRLFGRDLSDLTLSGKRVTGAANVAVESKSVSGEIHWKDQGRGQLTIKLARLYVPPSAQPTSGATDFAESLPGVEAQIQDFRLNDREFGRVVLSALPEGRQWRLQQLEFKSPDGSAQIHGSYDPRARPARTNLDINLDVTDVGNYLAHLKLPPGLKGGKAKLAGNVQWSGAPYSIDLPSLSGRLTLDAKQGQFVKLEPGVGKLLGVLSLQALPRRLTLDFRDVFSEGFAFSQISATSDIGGGVASTQDFRMTGSAAVVELKGSVDLVRETQTLKVRVLPGLSDSVSVAAGAIVNPAVGLATFLAQKVLKDPVNKLFAKEYEVTGTWADPSVKSLNRPSVPATGRR